MAGPAKKRAVAEKSNGSSNGSSSAASRDPTQRSEKSIPHFDGNRDPNVQCAVDYSDPRDLKNISDFLGLAGWYTARGVSINTLLSRPNVSYMHAPFHANTPHPTSPTTNTFWARILPLSAWLAA
jgi:eukaryotic translation initiation factor 2C